MSESKSFFIFLLLTCLFAAASITTSFAQNAQSDSEHSIEVGGIARTYLLHVPQSHTTTSALVLVFHGGGGSANGTRSITGLNKISDEHGFVVAYPQGLGSVWNDEGSDLGQRFKRDDVAFARQLVKDIAQQVPINEKQVFACGFSNGGALTTLLTLEAPDLIAAGAIVGSGIYSKHAQEHPNPKPIPVLFIEGTEDPCHPYLGGETTAPKFGTTFRGDHHGLVLSTDEAVSFWRAINKCSAKPEVVELPHRTTDDTSTTYKRWIGANGNDVAEYVVKGGGHCWPGGIQYFPVNVIGKTTYDFSASEAIWRFFAEHNKALTH